MAILEDSGSVVHFPGFEKTTGSMICGGRGDNASLFLGNVSCPDCLMALTRLLAAKRNRLWSGNLPEQL